MNAGGFPSPPSSWCRVVTPACLRFSHPEGGETCDNKQQTVGTEFLCGCKVWRRVFLPPCRPRGTQLESIISRREPRARGGTLQTARPPANPNPLVVGAARALRCCAGCRRPFCCWWCRFKARLLCVGIGSVCSRYIRCGTLVLSSPARLVESEWECLYFSYNSLIPTLFFFRCQVEVGSVVLTPQDLAMLSWGFSSLSQECLPCQV